MLDDPPNLGQRGGSQSRDGWVSYVEWEVGAADTTLEGPGREERREEGLVPRSEGHPAHRAATEVCLEDSSRVEARGRPKRVPVHA